MNAVYEYAGYLLSKGELPNIWSEYDERNGKPAYQRLGDVQFEVSNCDPSKSVIHEKIYEGDLLDVKSTDLDWVKNEKFKEFFKIRKMDFEGKDFTLLYGYIECKSSANYDVRSYLLIESFLVKKSDITSFEDRITGQTFEWNNRSDIHCASSLNNVYFGELYWADNIPDVTSEHQSIEIDELEEQEIVLKMQDFLNDDYYLKTNEPGDIVRRNERIQFLFPTEPTTTEYLWEVDSTSGAQDSLSANIPSLNIGKYLNLKSDPKNFQILDKDLKKATVTIDWEEESKNVQKMNYLRSDLLQKYMDEKDLVILYQVKQFTHDKTIPGVDYQVDFRGTQFFLPH